MPHEIDQRHITCPGSMTFNDDAVEGHRLTVQATKTFNQHGIPYGAVSLNHETAHILSANDLRLLSAWALSAAEWIEKQEKTHGA